MEQKGKHSKWVFTYKGSPIKKASNTSWKNTLEHVGIAPYKKLMYCPTEFSEHYNVLTMTSFMKKNTSSHF